MFRGFGATLILFGLGIPVVVCTLFLVLFFGDAGVYMLRGGIVLFLVFVLAYAWGHTDPTNFVEWWKTESEKSFWEGSGVSRVPQHRPVPEPHCTCCNCKQEASFTDHAVAAYVGYRVAKAFFGLF